MANPEMHFYLTVHKSVTMVMPVKQSVTIASVAHKTITVILDIVRAVFIRLEA
jgi:hypothetical protein